MAVRGPGRRRSRQLPLISPAAPQIHPAAGRSRPFAVRAVSDQQGKLPPKGGPRPYRPDLCKAAVAAVPVAIQARTNARAMPFTRKFRVSGADKMARFLCLNAVLFGLFWLAGAGFWFWAVWVLAMATWLPLVTRMRNIAEHACTSAPERSVQSCPYDAGQSRRTPVYRAVLGELSLRAPSVHVSAVLSPPRSTPAARGKGRNKQPLDRIGERGAGMTEWIFSR